jgi:hypothetical protein
LRFARLLGAGFGLAAITGACTSDLELALDGKLCAADQRCAGGYECYVPENRCYPLGQLPNNDGSGGSSGGTDGAGGNAGSAGVDDGGAGRSGAGGADSPGGSGGFGGAGGAGGMPIDPNNPDGGFILPDGGCLTTTVYHDVDGDTFGDDSDTRVACPSIEWVVVGGDCRDDQPLVFPGQLNHFAVGYPSSVSGGAGVSFDYDCVSGEVPDPNNVTNAEVPACASLLGIGCTGSGFQPASPARSGAGIEPRCGSNVVTTCLVSGVTCGPSNSTRDLSEAFRCK